MPLPLGAASPPQWVLPGAKYDFDFANNRYWGGQLWRGINSSVAGRSPSFIVYNGSSAAANTLFTQWKDGILRPQEVSQNLRISDYGLWNEGGATSKNWAFWCRDFTQSSWTLTTMTAAKTSVGATGVANSASRLTATLGGALALQTLTFTSRLFTVSAWIKRVTGTGTVLLTPDGVSGTDISGLINSTTYTQVRIASVTAANPTVGVQLGTNGDAIDIDFFQTEDGDQATSPIATLGAATNTRSNEMPAFGTPNSVATQNNAGGVILADIYYGTPASVLVQYSGNFSTTLSHLLCGTDGTFPIAVGTISAGGLKLTASGGNFTSTAADTTGLFTLNKACFTWDGFGIGVCINGQTPETSTAAKFYPSIGAGLTHGGQLNNGAGILPTNGYEKRITMWKKVLTAGEQVAYTTVTEPN